MVEFEWDGRKAKANLKKHGIDFADAVTALEDQGAATIAEVEGSEERFITLGADALGRILVVVYAWRDETVRLISARKAAPSEREQYEADR